MTTIGLRAIDFSDYGVDHGTGGMKKAERARAHKRRRVVLYCRRHSFWKGLMQQQSRYKVQHKRSCSVRRDERMTTRGRGTAI